MSKRPLPIERAEARPAKASGQNFVMEGEGVLGVGVGKKMTFEWKYEREFSSKVRKG